MLIKWWVRLKWLASKGPQVKDFLVRLFASAQFRKTLFILVVPFIFLVWVDKHYSRDFCLIPERNNQSTTFTYEELKSLEPIIKFTDSWFIADVVASNNLKSVGFRNVETGEYSQASEVSYVVMTPTDASVSLSVHDEKTIWSNLPISELGKRMASTTTLFAATPISTTTFSSGQHMAIDIGPGSDACIHTIFKWDYAILIYYVVLSVWIGTLLLFREACHFVCLPFLEFIAWRKSRDR